NTVDRAPDPGTHGALSDALANVQPAGLEGVDADLAEHAFDMPGKVHDFHTRDATAEQFAPRQYAATALAHRHDDFRHLEGDRGVRQRHLAGQHALGLHMHLLVRMAGVETADFDRRIIQYQRISHTLGLLAHADDEDA